MFGVAARLLRLTKLQEVPPPGFLGKIIYIEELTGKTQLQIRHNKRVMAKFVFPKELAPNLCLG
jgi:hypothetical protein